MNLHIFPKHPTADAYYVGGSYTPYAIVGRNKRFTDAELAAEYWRSREDRAYIVEGITWEAMCDEWPTREADALSREYILDQFASRPHYDKNM